MQRRYSTQTLAALVILAAFAVGLLASLAAGAGSYQRLSRRSQSAYDQRTAWAYLSARVRQGERVSLEPFGQGQALCLHQNFGSRAYITRIYCHDGWLMELFTADSGEFSPGDGERVMPLDKLDGKIEEGLLTLTFSDSGGSHHLVFSQPEVTP